MLKPGHACSCFSLFHSQKVDPSPKIANIFLHPICTPTMFFRKGSIPCNTLTYILWLPNNTGSTSCCSKEGDNLLICPHSLFYYRSSSPLNCVFYLFPECQGYETNQIPQAFSFSSKFSVVEVLYEYRFMHQSFHQATTML